MMHDLARVGLVGVAHGVDPDTDHTAREDFLRIEELWSLISHLFCPTAFRSSEQVLSSRLQYREAVMKHSPGLPRLAATLGTEITNDRNPNGVVTVSQTVCLVRGV